MPRLPCLFALLSVFAIGCAGTAKREVGGSTDARMEQLSAELEELRARAHAAGGAPAASCGAATGACRIADEMCSLAEGEPARDDFQRECVHARERCAQLRDACERN